jgi:hypothetical protein
VSVSILDGGRTLRVADRGCGIKDKRRALEPGFSTADEQARQIISGVGAGLSVASRLMAEAGGRLDLCDNLGTGTVATLALPAQPAPAAPAPDVRAPEVTVRRTAGGAELSDNGKRILLLLAELGGAAVPTICNELRLSMPEADAELDALRRQQLLDPRAGRQMVLTSTGLTYLDGIFVE